MHGQQRCSLLLQMFRGLCVCLLVTTVRPTETAEPIEMPFGLWNRVGPRNHVLGGPGSPQGQWQFRGLKYIILCTQQTQQQHGAADLSAGDSSFFEARLQNGATRGTMRPFVRIL